MKKIFNITSRDELAFLLGVPIQNFTHLLYIKKPNNYYYTFEIPKKNGDKRTIHAPNGDLKTIQRKLAFNLWEYQKSICEQNNNKPNISHAFEKDKSILTNAKTHKNKRFVYNLDLENFFDSFHFGRVQGFFQKNKNFNYSYEVATIIAQLTCFNGCLPQGAPTSPIITNLICEILDFKILKIAKKYKLDYTRYADDLTFSTNNKQFLENRDLFFVEMKQAIESAGFRINDNKTSLRFKDSKQIVTGLIVNKKLSVDYNYCRKTKAMAHHLYVNGEFSIESEVGNINQLEGRFSFINQLDRYNNKLSDEKHTFWTLNGREKQYQKFLFYKYFISHDMPLIVTEGKTDILYLKSALKNLYAQYPNLIEKTSNNQFKFKVKFLRKSNRLSYFLGIVPDGADTMKNLYNYFVDSSSKDTKNFPNYLNYFKKLNPKLTLQPIFFVFDNELKNGKKPLSNFANHTKLNEVQKKELQDTLKVRLFAENNLFLITNPLTADKQECEIEDLFDNTILEQEINGKTFSRKKDYDVNQFYGKEIFSKYIATEYKKINFENFKPILNNINNLIELSQIT